MKRIRVALVTNALGPPTRGNGTTVGRWRGWLPDVYVDVFIVTPGNPLPPGSEVDLIHGYHAIHGGRDAARLAKAHGLSFVLSLGGTDVFDLDTDDPRAGVVREVVAAATLVTGAFPGFASSLKIEDGRPLYATVPRGVLVPDGPPPEPDPKRLRAALPAGLRYVKDPLLGIRLADALVERGLPLSLRILGPALDPAFAEIVEAEVAARDHVTLAELARGHMPAAYAESDVVWNMSLHEGGSNALLEGLGAGCAVYARNVGGNRDMLSGDGAPGVLFDPEAAGWLDRAERFHRRLLEETPATRGVRVRHTRGWLHTHHDPRSEVRALRLAYERALDV